MDKIKLPAPFNDVSIDVWLIQHDDEVWLRYFGLPEGLIASGACEPQMFLKKEKRNTPRLDADGHRYRTESYFVSRDGQPVRRFKVSRHKPMVSALRLPGAREAIARYKVVLLETAIEESRIECEVQQLHARWREEAKARVADVAPTAKSAAKGRLHLIVNNE